MDKQELEFKRVYSEIFKKVKNKKWKCIQDSCDQDAINSHLLQKNGILTTIAQNGLVVEVRMADVFKWDQKAPPAIFEHMHINQALSMKLFCDKHDGEIFKPVETFPINLESYKNQLLLSYRVVCAEARKKEMVIEFYTKLLSSKTLQGLLMEDRMRDFIVSCKRGLQDLALYQQLFESELAEPQDMFEFSVFSYPMIKVYGSAVYSPYESLSTPFEEIPLKYIFIHVVPRDEQLMIIVGFHKNYNKPTIGNYIRSWDGLNMKDLELKLTNLFASKIENWGMSPKIHRNIKPKVRAEFVKYFSENTLNYLDDQITDFNLFENENYG